MRNFKILGKIILFFGIIIIINGGLNFLLYPYTYTRVDIHNIKTGEYDDIFLGSSHGKSAINPLVIDEVTNRKSTNLCMGGEYPIDVYHLAKEVARNHKPSRIIYELDPGYWVSDISEDTSYATFYNEMSPSMVKLEYFWAKMAGSDFRNTLFPWYMYRKEYKNAFTNARMKLGDGYKNYDLSTFTSTVQSYEPEGFINIHRIEAPKTEDNLILWNESELKADAVKYFNKLVDFCADEEIELMVIATPLPTETYEKYGLEFDAAHAYFTEYFEQMGIPYYNFNKIYLPGFDRSLESFSDYEGHMYGDAAAIFSKLLGEHLVAMSPQ